MTTPEDHHALTIYEKYSLTAPSVHLNMNELIKLPSAAGPFLETKQKMRLVVNSTSLG